MAQATCRKGVNMQRSLCMDLQSLLHETWCHVNTVMLPVVCHSCRHATFLPMSCLFQVFLACSSFDWWFDNQVVTLMTDSFDVLELSPEELEELRGRHLHARMASIQHRQIWCEQNYFRIWVPTPRNQVMESRVRWPSSNCATLLPALKHVRFLLLC